MDNKYLRKFALSENEYVCFPVGNHVSKKAFLLNAIGNEILNEIEKYSPEDISLHLAKKYAIDYDECYNDVKCFISELYDNVESGSNKLRQNENHIQYSIRNKILENYYKEKRPYNVFVELTYNCNLRCPHCYLQEELTTTDFYIKKDKVFKILDELEMLHTVNVFFTGGEAMLHPDILDILAYASNKNLLVTLLSNAQLMTDEILQELVKIPLYDVQVSLYGNEQEHDSFVKKRGAFQQTKRVLSFLQKEKGIGTAAYVITQGNTEHVTEVIKEFKELSIPIHFSTNIMPTVNGNNKPIDLRVYDREVLKSIFRQSTGLLNGSKCNAGVCRFRITPSGDVHPCEMMHHITLGNINDQSLKEILNSEKHMEWIKKFEQIKENHKCGTCEKNKYCSFCPGMFYQETGRYETPSQYSCYMAEIKNEVAEEKLVVNNN